MMSKTLRSPTAVQQLTLGHISWMPLNHDKFSWIFRVQVKWVPPVLYVYTEIEVHKWIISDMFCRSVGMDAQLKGTILN